MNQVQSYKDLVAWQRACELVKQVYQVTKAFPPEEQYGLVQQVRRAAVSVPSNIAEGYGRGSRKEYVRFLQMARGSLYEVQTQLILAGDLGYATPDRLAPANTLVEQCSRLLHALLTQLTKAASAHGPDKTPPKGQRAGEPSSSV